MLGMKLLSDLFKPAKPTVIVLPKTEAALPEVQPEPAKVVILQPLIPSGVGEPVVSLVKSILETEDWEEVIDFRDAIRHGFRSLSFRHVSNPSLQVAFSWINRIDYDRLREREREFKCCCDWMTDDEKAYMISMVPEFRKMLVRREQERRLRCNAATRERFMRELVEHHGQLELNLT